METGELEGADPNAPYCAVSNAYTEDVSYDGHIRTVKHDGLYDQARAIEPRLKGRSDHVLGQFLKKQGCTNTERVLRRRGWTFPTLDVCRKDWLKRWPEWKWLDPMTTEWRAKS